MKVLLALLSALTIGGSASGLAVEATTAQHMPHTPISTKGNDSAMNLSQAPYDPSYPSIPSSFPDLKAAAETDGNGYQQSKSTVQIIDVSQYAANWKDFVNEYNEIKVLIDYYMYGNHSHRTGEEGSFSRSYSVKLIDISTNSDNSEIDVAVNGSFRGNSDIWNYKSLDYDKNTIAKGAKGTAAIASRVWHDDMKLYVKVSACANENGGSGTVHPRANITLKQIDIDNAANAGSKATALSSALSTPYKFTSITSTSMNSDIHHSIVSGEDVNKINGTSEYATNENMIKAEMFNRIKKSLDNDLDAWAIEEDNLPNTIEKMLDPTKTKVKITQATDSKGNLTNQGTATLEVEDSTGSRGLSKAGKFPKTLSMPIQMDYDVDGMKKTVNSWFNKTFEFSSDFSPKLDNENFFSSQKEGAVSYKSNKQMITDEIKKRLTDHLKGDDASIVENMMGNNAISYDQDNSRVKITFAKDPNNQDDYITNNQWVDEVYMPVKIDLTPLYFQRSVADRLDVLTGYIIDPKTNNNNPDEKNKFVLDHPSYDDKTKTYTYHNSLDLTFTSHTGMNEVLYVNNQPVPVMNNVFHIVLKDQRKITNDNKASEPTKYEIWVSTPDPDKSDIKFNVVIDSVANNVNYQWEGWHPKADQTDEISYNQWLLTQPKIKEDGKMVVNKKYNPLINASTGMISNTVFVKSGNWNPNGDNGGFNNHRMTGGTPQGDPNAVNPIGRLDNKYPFADDVLDDNNHLIRTYEPVKDKNGKTQMDPNGQKDSNSDLITPLTKPVMHGHFEDGYIAEAVVANSGVNNLTDKLENVDHVERVQLDPTTLQEIGETQTLTPEQLTNEKQFSDEGLWHYIIYMKNHVDDLLNPKKSSDNHNTPATAGSTIHKLLYIKQSVADTGSDFLGLPFVQNNPNIQPFWSTSQAEHLKSYLVEKGFDSEGIKNASYENIVSYWYQYVSDVQNGLSVPAPHYYFQLDKLGDMPQIKLNSGDATELKQSISKQVRDYLDSKGGASLVENTDYVITDTLNDPQPLNNANLDDMIADYNAGKDGEKKLYICALSSSTIAKGYTSFNVLDSINVDPDRIYDLSKIAFNDETYDFSNLSLDDFKYKWIDHRVHELLLQNRADGDSRNITYGKDYIITLNGSDKDYKVDSTSDDVINSFLEDAKKNQSLSPDKNNGKNQIILADDKFQPELPKGYDPDNLPTSDDESGAADFDPAPTELVVHIKAIDTSAVLTGKVQSTLINDPTAEPAPKIQSKLSNIFANTNLGDVQDTNKNGYIDSRELWDALMAKNPYVANDYPDLTFDMMLWGIYDSGNPMQAVMRVDSTKNTDYVGSLILSFTSDKPVNPDTQKIDISKIFTKLDLGELEFNIDPNLSNDSQKNAIDREIWNKLLEVNNLTDDKTLVFEQFSIINLDTAKPIADDNGYLHYHYRIVANNSLAKGTENKVYSGHVDTTFYSKTDITPIDPPVNPDKPDDTGLSKKAKIWIISASIGVAAVIGLILAWWLRRRKTKKKMR